MHLRIRPVYKSKKVHDSLALSLSVILFISVGTLFVSILFTEQTFEKKAPQTTTLKKILTKPAIKSAKNIQLPPPPPLKVKHSKKIDGPVITIVPIVPSLIQPKVFEQFKPLEVSPNTLNQKKKELPSLNPNKLTMRNLPRNNLKPPNHSSKKSTERKSSVSNKSFSKEKINTFANGRVLLRQLENGKGPEIQIAWPNHPSLKEKIYNILTKCYGMQTARMNSKDELFYSIGPSGVQWAINMDKMSGFIREVSGLTPEAEQSRVRMINRKHPKESFKSTIRIFPRVVDAHLLARLRSIAGEKYSKSKNINAAYGIKNNAIFIKNIRLDDKELARDFRLPGIKNQCS